VSGARLSSENQIRDRLHEFVTGDAALGSRIARSLLGLLTEWADVNHAADLAITDVPARLQTDTECPVYDRERRFVGRVDWRLFSPGEFCLDVELKFGSGYHDDQIDRYVEDFRYDGVQGGLLGVTTEVPTIGEPGPDEEVWLGSLRWAHVIPTLRALPCDSRVATQWQAFLDRLVSEAYVGMEAVDARRLVREPTHPNVIKALARLLDRIAPRLLRALRDLSMSLVGETSVDYYTSSPGGVLVNWKRHSPRLGFVVPDYAGVENLWVEMSPVTRGVRVAIEVPQRLMAVHEEALSPYGFVRHGRFLKADRDLLRVIESRDAARVLLEATLPLFVRGAAQLLGDGAR
jgi:hypothetical protein